MELVSLLKSLSEASGVSGYEGPVRDIVREALAPYCDEIQVDAELRVLELGIPAPVVTRWQGGRPLPREGPGEEALARVTILTGSAAAQELQAGDEVVASITEAFDGTELVAVSEPYRLPALGLLVLVFGLVMILVGGWQGLRALVGL